MVRKRRTELPGGGESSGPQDSSAGHGAPQRPPQQQPQQQGQVAPQRSSQQQQPQQQQGRGAPQRPPQQLQQQGGVRGSAPQQPGGAYQGRGGYDGGRGGPRGGMAPQQYTGGPPEFYQQPRGPVPQSRGGVASGARGGFVSSAGGPSRPSVPELHQATQAPQQAGVMTQPMPHVLPAEDTQSVASPVVGAANPSSLQLTQKFQQISIKPESSSTEAVQSIPMSTKSLRFPPRPGRGSTGSRVIVKANHFFAELPDKDLHQYDVSSINPFNAILKIR